MGGSKYYFTVDADCLFNAAKISLIFPSTLESAFAPRMISIPYKMPAMAQLQI